MEYITLNDLFIVLSIIGGTIMCCLTAINTFSNKKK